MKNEQKWLFATVTIIALLYLFSLTPIRYLGNVDSGQYLVVSKSLVERHGYYDLSFPSEPPLKSTLVLPAYLVVSKSLVERHGYYDLSFPSEPPLKSTLVLPAYPILLSPAFVFANGNFFVARLISAIFGIASLFVFYYIAREFFDSKESLFIMAIVGLSPFMMIYSRTILTEVPYTFFSLTALLLLHKSSKNEKLELFVLGGIFVFLASLTRIVGITLFASSILYFVIKKEYKKAAYFVLIIASFIFVGYLANYHFSIFHRPSKAYSPQRLFGRIAGNVKEYLLYFIPVNMVTPMLFLEEVFGIKNYLYVVGFFVSLITGLGFIKQIKRGTNIFHIHTLVFTAFIFINAGVAGNGRYMMPLLVFFLVYFVEGLKQIVYKTRTLKSFSIEPNVACATLLLVLLSSSFCCGTLLARASHYREMPIGWKNYFSAAEWIVNHGSENNIIIAARHNDFYLFSNRKVVPIANPADIMNIIERYKVRYVMESSTGGDSQEEIIASAVSRYNDKFELVYSTGEPFARIYEVKM